MTKNIMNRKAVTSCKANLRQLRKKGLSGMQITDELLKIGNFKDKTIKKTFTAEGYEFTYDEDNGDFPYVSNQPTKKMLKVLDCKINREEAFSTWAAS